MVKLFDELFIFLIQHLYNIYSVGSKVRFVYVNLPGTFSFAVSSAAAPWHIKKQATTGTPIAKL